MKRKLQWRDYDGKAMVVGLSWKDCIGGTMMERL
jgi:hypothetical protein